MPDIVLGSFVSRQPFVCRGMAVGHPAESRRLSRCLWTTVFQGGSDNRYTYDRCVDRLRPRLPYGRSTPAHGRSGSSCTLRRLRSLSTVSHEESGLTL